MPKTSRGVYTKLTIQLKDRSVAQLQYIADKLGHQEKTRTIESSIATLAKLLELIELNNNIFIKDKDGKELGMFILIN
jgi:hypothetical protein